MIWGVKQTPAIINAIHNFKCFLIAVPPSYIKIGDAVWAVLIPTDGYKGLLS